MDAPASWSGESPGDPFALPCVAAAVVDGRGRVVGWSGAAEALLGYPPDEVLGAPAGTLVDPADRGIVHEAVTACLNEHVWFGLLPVRHRSGRRVSLGLRVREVIRNGDEREWIAIGAPAEEVTRWETDRSVLDGLFRRCPVGLSVHAPDLSFLRVNRAVARFGEMPLEQYPGHRIADFMIAPDAETAEQSLRWVLQTGKPLIFTEQPWRFRHSPQKEMRVSISAFRVQDALGRVLGVTGIVEDVTDRHRAQRRLALLGQAGARIGSALDVKQTAEELARVGVPDFADFVAVDLVECVLDGAEPPADGSVRMCRMAVHGIRDDHPFSPVGEVFELALGTPQKWAIDREKAVLEADLQAARAWRAQHPGQASAILGFGIRSRIVAPLWARGVLLGMAYFWRSQQREPFDTDDLSLAEELVARAAVCVDNARRYTRERGLAAALQRSLLPRGTPEQSALEVASRYLPAQSVGGDWFDVIPLPGTRVALAVGDVVGHGLHAAATMGRLRTAVRNFSALDLAPDELLWHLDDLVARIDQEEAAAGGPATVTGASCLYAVYDPTTCTCTMARAAHPPPAVVLPDGTVEFPDIPAGPPLGLVSLPFETSQVRLPEGSQLVLYTDGLIEQPDRDIDDSLARLRTTLGSGNRTPEETCGAVLEALLPARPGAPSDDIALLVARTRALATEQIAQWRVPSDPAAVADVRAAVGHRLRRWGLDDAVFTTEVILSELVTNAIRHATGPIGVRLLRDRSLICEVSDTSSTSPHLRHAATTDEDGRGLFLVAQLAQRWGTRYLATGKVIWSEQAIPEPRAKVS